MRRNLAIFTAAVCITACSFALADKVIFKNGDVLTGKIGEYDGKTLSIKTDKAGDVKVKLEDVKTFSTDVPIPTSAGTVMRS